MSRTPSSPRVKPPALHKGDTIAIIAPASNTKREHTEAGAERLRELGYQTLFLDSIFDKDLYFAGTLERRVRELEEMFVRDDVRAIVCARGGYGTNYLLERLDLHKIRRHPKIFAGYSDVTSLLTHFADAGLVVFHAPMINKDFRDPVGVDFASWEAAVSGASSWIIAQGSGAKPLVPGSAEGILYGGCLSILVASLGTPYEIHTAGTLLFLEDIATKPYQVDRMLMQLKLAGKLRDVRGILFGEMLDCVQVANQGYTLEEVVLRVVGDLGIPVAYGLRSGHVSHRNITLPFGVRAALQAEAENVSLQILEPATEA
jgi:muramoyltetrapeptide carboxypeptidase